MGPTPWTASIWDIRSSSLVLELEWTVRIGGMVLVRFVYAAGSDVRPDCVNKDVESVGPKWIGDLFYWIADHERCFIIMVPTNL